MFMSVKRRPTLVQLFAQGPGCRAWSGCAVVFLVPSLLKGKFLEGRQPAPSATNAASLDIHSPTPDVPRPTQRYPMVTLLPSTPEPAILLLAESALNNGNLQDVKDILLPGLQSLEAPADLARAYRLLGDAEYQQGYYQLAAGYYEKLYRYEPDLENLYLLATVYDTGGDLEAAYQKYQLLESASDLQASGRSEMVAERLRHLGDILERRHNGRGAALL
jgi:tetratricopeptide (TPR) repeat protein